MLLDGSTETQNQDILEDFSSTPESSEPEPPPCTQPSLKRRRSSSPDVDEESESGQTSPSGMRNDSLHDENESSNPDIYGASRFGEFGEYMRRKRAKLQIQNADMDEGEDKKEKIFTGLAIYINGWTEPSVQDLRELIVRHGGTFHAYLDKKALVTHIVTCSLTPAKILEFKHMKVVKPEWLVESAEAGVLLPWANYIFVPGERVEASQGRKVAQKSLNAFIPQELPPLKARSNFSKDDQKLRPVADGTAKDGGTSPDQPQRLCTPPSRDFPISTQRNVSKPSSRPYYSTDPAAMKQASRFPGYAAESSNAAAQRAMQSAAWRAQHTSVAGAEFIEGYYKNSRLHHLSTWKAELRGLVQEAMVRAEKGLVETLTGNEEMWGDGPVGEAVKENVGGSGATAGREFSMRGAELVLRSPKAKGKAKAALDDKVIMHCDFDAFFVSAGLIDRPHLRGKPVVVCHSQGTQGGAASTSEIASASYEARKFGIRGGMSLQQARKLCPDVTTIPYEFEKYKKYSLEFYTILMAHADDLQAVSVDEALIDVSSSIMRVRNRQAKTDIKSTEGMDPATELAEAIRAQVRQATGCEVSIGISHNILLARLATRRAKPNGSYHLLPTEVPAFLAPLNIDDIHGFGYSHHSKAQEKLGTTNLGDLLKKSKAQLCEALGKGTGDKLYKALRGVDDRELEGEKERKSVSCEINYGIRFEDNEQAEKFMYQLAEEVARRLDQVGMKGRSLTLKIMKRDPKAPVEPPKFMGHGACETFNKQAPMNALSGRATSDPNVIGEHAWHMLKAFNFDPKELRGIGIQITKLEKAAANNASLESGQAKLSFKPNSPEISANAKVDSEQTVEAPIIMVQPPSQDDDVVEIIEKPSEIQKLPPTSAESLDLPSLSQVDKSVFDALPEDIRKELDAEYKRRSESPAPAPAAGNSGFRKSESKPYSKGKIVVRGTTTNVKRITQQLAPKSRPSISPQKNRLFATKQATAGPSAVHASDAELKRLGIDADVFRLLPVDLQYEQLTYARTAKVKGAVGIVVPRKILKPSSRPSRSPSVPIVKKPLPKAKHVESPSLKQQGKTKGEKLYFTETDDVQRVIEQWVEGFKEIPPNRKDVEFFEKWLLASVDSNRSGDLGLERATEVMKWWLVLLRKHFAPWEEGCEERGDEERERITTQLVGTTWWKAFRDVKVEMDAVARRKFGGCLVIR